MNRHHESPWPERAEGQRVREINRKDESYKNQDMNSKRHTGYPRGTARNQGASAGGYRPPAPARYAAPNAHGGPPAPPRPRGQYPANYGRAEVAQPSGGYGNRNRNLYQAPVMFPGCYNCGDPSRRAHECPTRPDRPTTPAPHVAAPRQPDVRPMKRRSDKPEKTCIRVRYRHHKLRALIDTRSDVSIAGQDVARKMGWPIYVHHTKEVSVANNKTMTILGAARVVLFVAGHGVESEVLIAPDLDGLILGIDWLRSQGRVKWDFDRGRIKFGKRDWVALIQETEQPYRTSIIRKGFSITDHGSGLYHRGSDSDRPAFHAAPTGSARRFCCSISDRGFLREVPLLCRAILLAENWRECCKTSEPGIRHRVSDIRHRVRDDVIATLSLYPPCPPWARYLIVRSARRILWRLFRFRLSSSEVLSTEECTKLKMAAVRLEHL